MTLRRAKNWTAWPGDEHANHEADGWSQISTDVSVIDQKIQLLL